jgi:hypothetical protein
MLFQNQEERDHAIQESLQRTRRIETRLMKLCTGLGIDPTDSKVRFVLVSTEPPIVDLTGYDVCFSEVLTFCSKNGLNTVVTLTCKGQTLGTIVPIGDPVGSDTATKIAKTLGDQGSARQLVSAS